ncbi:MAG: hypothetical protein ACYDHP_02365 [Ferrimicrobium sp.]
MPWLRDGANRVLASATELSLFESLTTRHVVGAIVVTGAWFVWPGLGPRVDSNLVRVNEDGVVFRVRPLRRGRCVFGHDTSGITLLVPNEVLVITAIQPGDRLEVT